MKIKLQIKLNLIIFLKVNTIYHKKKDTMGEKWKAISGYNGRYEVSTMGNIRSNNYNNKKKKQILKARTTIDRYPKVTLIDGDGNRKTHYVHRLVAAAFLSAATPDEKYVNHKNGEKQLNVVENLEFTTARGNSRNPATYENYHRRYHRPGEWERRSKGQKERFKRERETGTGRYKCKPPKGKYPS